MLLNLFVVKGFPRVYEDIVLYLIKIIFHFS
jgi:hypothetical protein